MNHVKAILFVPLLPFIILGVIAGCIYGVTEMCFKDGKDWILK